VPTINNPMQCNELEAINWVKILQKQGHSNRVSLKIVRSARGSAGFGQYEQHGLVTPVVLFVTDAKLNRQFLSLSAGTEGRI
jgi:hypothetical protein